MEPTKKISFGFSKLSKKPLVVRTAPVEQKKVELVECLEGQSIKIKDAVEVVHEPLVIPIKDNKRNLLDRIKEAKAKQKELVKKEIKEEKDTRPDSELSIEELAARELINEAKNRLSNKQAINNQLVLPVKKEEVTLEGEKEPTLDDYESVPISDYGMAMLRGMGWKEGMGIGKNTAQSVAPNVPELRPKGLGLGATKMVNADLPKTACDKDGKELILKRGTYAKIIAGSHKGEYCEVQGLDDEAGRVIVKTSLKGEILTLNEFLIIPVTKEEYSKGSKVLNNAKYEEYMERSDKKLERHRKAQSSSSDEEVNGAGSSVKNVMHKRSENSRSRYSSDDEKYLRVKQEPGRSSRKSENYENEKVAAPDKHSRNKSKYREKERYRSSSSSESDSERRQRKNKKNKKSRHRERSRSREARHKKSVKSKNRSSSSDSEEKGTRKKNKSKSRHRKSSSSDTDYRSSKK